MTTTEELSTDDYIRSLNAGSVEPWAEMLPLSDGCAVPFPVDALPAGMAAAVLEVAEAVKVDPAIPAQAAVGVLAGLLGPSTEVVINSTWRPHCNVWVATVAGSTDGKSPASSPFWVPLSVREVEVRTAAEQERYRAEVMLPVLEAQLKAMQKDKNATEQVGQMVVLAAEIETAKKVLSRTPRVFVDDVTPERLAQIMAENDGAITAVNDEGSLFSHLDGQYSTSPNMNAVLKSWEGSTAKVDRKGGNGTPGDELTIERPCMTLIAAVQPVMVGRLGRSSHGLEERGLLGRVLWSWPPSRAGERLMSGHNPDAYVALPLWNDRIGQLAAETEAATVEMSVEGRAAFYAWHDAVEAGLSPGGVYADMATFAPKIRESVARIAGLFARVDGSVIVSAEHVSRAIALGDFYLAHTSVVVESWSAGQTGIAKKLLAKIQNGDNALACPDCSEEVPAGVAAFRVREAARAMRCTTAIVIDALEVLAQHGYVRPADPVERFGDDKRRVSKVSPLVLVNPGMWA